MDKKEESPEVNLFKVPNDQKILKIVLIEINFKQTNITGGNIEMPKILAIDDSLDNLISIK